MCNNIAQTQTHHASISTHSRLARAQESRDDGNPNFLRLALLVVGLFVVDHHVLVRILRPLRALDHGNIFFGDRHCNVLIMVCSMYVHVALIEWLVGE